MLYKVDITFTKCFRCEGFYQKDFKEIDFKSTYVHFLVPDILYLELIHYIRVLLPNFLLLDLVTFCVTFTLFLFAKFVRGNY